MNGTALGLAIVVVTAVICLALFPLYRWQARTQRRLQAEQRLIAPELAELRRKYRREPQKLNEELMRLYRKHDISPFSTLTGCMPSLVQLPILCGLYRGIRAATDGMPASGHGFLWMGDVSKSPHDLLAQGFATHWSVVILPVLAAAASFAQAKMKMQPARPDMSEQELKAHALSKTMLFLAPSMVLLVGFTLPQGLSIYWLGQTLVAILHWRRSEQGGPMRPGGRGPGGGSPGDPAGRPVGPRMPDPSREAWVAEELVLVLGDAPLCKCAIVRLGTPLSFVRAPRPLRADRRAGEGAAVTAAYKVPSRYYQRTTHLQTTRCRRHAAGGLVDANRPSTRGNGHEGTRRSRVQPASRGRGGSHPVAAEGTGAQRYGRSARSCRQPADQALR